MVLLSIEFKYFSSFYSAEYLTAFFDRQLFLEKHHGGKLCKFIM